MPTERNATLGDIAPRVRFAGIVEVTHEDLPEPRVGYVHRIFYLQSDRCHFTVGGEEYALERGGLLLLLSGTPYRILAPAEGATLLVINFDFFGGDNTPGEKVPTGALPLSLYHEEERVERVCFREGIFRHGYAVLRDASAYQADILAMIGEERRGEVFCANQLRAYLTLLLNRIFRRLLLARPVRGRDGHEEILTYLALHATEPLDNKMIGAIFHYHPNYVSDLIRAATGMPLHKYLLHLRLHRATELLLSGGLPIGEIARLCGFGTPAYFSEYFKRTYGCTPAVYRAANS